MSNETAATWITVGELGNAFGVDHYGLPPAPGLAGKSFQFSWEDGTTTSLSFASPESLIADGKPYPYRSSAIRPELVFIDFVDDRGPIHSHSFVVDLGQGIALAILGTLPGKQQTRVSALERIADHQELTLVKVTFLHGVLNRPWTPDAPKFSETDELVGKRAEYRYSPHEAYEHIYLNRNFYTWHCLSGSEFGLCDTDAAHYYKLGDSLYLFLWREKLVPTLGLVLIDYRQMRTTGKICGWEDLEFKALRNFEVGAHARLLDDKRPEGPR
jgi:hypothetical protein